jgi:hypothetical protein
MMKATGCRTSVTQLDKRYINKTGSLVGIPNTPDTLPKLIPPTRIHIS